MSTQEYVKYIFMDIVEYSHQRPIEAQESIISCLNGIVKEVIQSHGLKASTVIYLPTGDGICICLVNQLKPFDLGLIVALGILERIAAHNQTTDDEKLQFSVRIGINENVDNQIIDINKRKNLAGTGINDAQRIMNCGDGGNVLLGKSIYEKICDRTSYFGKFARYVAKVKHGKLLDVFQYIDSNLEYLNSRTPDLFTVTEKPIREPSQFLGFYSWLTIKHRDKLAEIVRESASDEYELRLILIYGALRLQANFNSTAFNRDSSYDEFDKYFVGKLINVEAWHTYLRGLGTNYLIDLSELMFERHIGDAYEYYFKKGTKFLQLSKSGDQYFGSHFALERQYLNAEI